MRAISFKVGRRKIFYCSYTNTQRSCLNQILRRLRRNSFFYENSKFKRPQSIRSLPAPKKERKLIHQSVRPPMLLCFSILNDTGEAQKCSDLSCFFTSLQFHFYFLCNQLICQYKQCISAMNECIAVW